MKIERKEIAFFLAGIVSVAVAILIYEFSGSEEEQQEGGSHGVYDHHDHHDPHERKSKHPSSGG